jgi:hypothetical protein
MLASNSQIKNILYPHQTAVGLLKCSAGASKWGHAGETSSGFAGTIPYR